MDDDPLGRRLMQQLPAPLRSRLAPEDAALVIADGIARRAGATMAPGAWQVWSLLRGVASAVTDGVLAADRELRALVRDLEARHPA
ncbi:hypothetical protein ACFSVJ_00655 [Prauserella oleivorans]